MLRLLKKLGSKIVDQVLGNLSSYVLIAIAPVAISIIIAIRLWLSAGFSITLPLGVWLLLLFAVMVCLVLPARSLANSRRRLTNPADVKNAINEWFSNGDRQIELPVEEDRQYHFSDVDKILGIKRGSARRCLPMLARRRNYGLHAGAKTFALVRLSKANDIACVLSEFVEAGTQRDKKEAKIDCDIVARRVGWPPEGVIQFFYEIKTRSSLYENAAVDKIDVLVVKGRQVILRALE